MQGVSNAIILTLSLYDYNHHKTNGNLKKLPHVLFARTPVGNQLPTSGAQNLTLDCVINEAATLLIPRFSRSFYINYSYDFKVFQTYAIAIPMSISRILIVQ